MTSTTRVVVIGGGMAGARLARQLTAAPATSAGAGGAVDAAVTVTVIGEEPHPPYNRVLLAEVLAGRYAPEVIALPSPGSGVRRLSGVRAVRIDRDARRVLCDDGQDVPYDILVLATGANPVLPPLRGLFTPGRGDLPDGVHPFRTMDDCQALAAAVRPGAPVVVIGGGLLGVSAARALAGRGAQVVLAHQGEHLMERHLDADAAALLGRHMAALGIEVHTECRVRGIETGPQQAAPAQQSPAGPDSPAPRAVRAVELADGFRLDAELVVLACGVRPRIGLAEAAGLDVGRGIRVDDTLRTSDPRIFAIGDCAEHNGTVYGLAGAAQEQADAVARVLPHVLAGAPSGPAAPAPSGTAPYTGTRALTRLTLASQEAPATTPPTGSDGSAGSGDPTSPTSPTSPSFPFDLAAFGETTPLPGDDVVRLSDATRTSYRKVVVRGDRLVGGILLGDLGTVGALARTWEGDEPLPAAPLLHLLTTDGGF
ncbi:NAD(P)/FAD-dependent oxidoreductase [Streptomyces piniterrae]|uniref:NAD(P)/FAD-dependent oxidoreductase n=1 Tax=Streptomyces piniterrae TaxID=2571125 RepID=A0A4U0NN61_9ACTN|nr:FAD-dependent oxidoreductase [Streptomyces piniterrae]TJZ55713.1 NAD(P)/FAD-dependent oxidoreductase [Streptomyces piniterrae]